jgi:hypothetical protein
MSKFGLPCAVLASLLLLISTNASADKVTVKGVVLEGTVKSITAKEIVIETVYGKGAIAIAVKDVEAIETSEPFHIYHDDHVETIGPVVGISPDAVRVQGEGGAPVDIAFSDVFVAKRDPGAEANVFERATVEHPYWHGNFDFAFNTTQATDDTLGIATALGLRRERGPSRLRMGAAYLLARQKDHGESYDTTANEIRGFLRQEYDLTRRLFVFGSFDAEYDEIESLSLRAVPKVGPGLKVYQSENAWFSVESGFAYVYERFFGGDENQYPGMAFGAESDWKLPWLGASWHNRLDYTPSFEDWLGDYLLRYETSLLVPVISAVSFKLSLIDSYDSTPADDNERNTLAILVGLSLGF